MLRGDGILQLARAERLGVENSQLYLHSEFLDFSNAICLRPLPV